ncbi:hypothetical protein ACI2KR_21370 [Pseudomonas luteola]
MRKPKPSILQTLGVASVTSFWHGMPTIKRSIQAAMVASLVGITVTHAVNEDRTSDLLLAQRSTGSLTLHDANLGRVSDLALALDTQAGTTGYFLRDAFELDTEFKQAIERQISSIIYHVESSGSWDMYVATDLAQLYLSDDMFDRQVANAVLGYLQRHEGRAAIDLTKPSQYTRIHAADLEADRQIFMMADAMAEAQRAGGRMPITRQSSLKALNSFAAEPERLLASFNVARGNELPGMLNVGPLAQAALQVEIARLSLTSLVGQMLNMPEVIQNPAWEAINLGHRLNCPVELNNKYSGTLRAHYQPRESSPTREMLSTPIRSGIDFSEQGGFALFGRGVVLTQVPMVDASLVKLPEVRYTIDQVLETQRQLEEEPIYDMDFRMSV